MLRLILALLLVMGISAPASATDYYPYPYYPVSVCDVVQTAMPGPETANCTQPTDSWWEVRMADDPSLPVIAAADHPISAANAFGAWFMAHPVYSVRCPYTGPFNTCYLMEQWNVSNMESGNGGCDYMSPYTVITGSGATNHNDNAPYGQALSGSTWDIVIGRVVDLDFEPWPGHNCAHKDSVKKMEIFPLDESPNGKAFARLSGKCAPGEYLQSYVYDWDPNETGESIFWCNNVPAPSSAIPLESTSGLDSDRQGCAYGCNPVDIVSGAKLDYVVDYVNHSPYPIIWDRRYDSRQGVWTFNYDRKLYAPSVGGARPLEAVINRPDSSKLRFTRASSSSPWVADDLKALGALTSQAVTGGESFEYTNLLDEIEVYGVTGKLVELRNTIGQKLSFEYHVSGGLQRVEDDFGRYLDVRMTPATAGSNPISVTDGNKTVEYTFTISGSKNLLTQVVYPDGEDIDYLYDEGLPAGGGLLTGIVPENEVRWGTYTYSFDYGPTPFVSSTAHGSGKDLTLYDIYPGAYAFVDWDEGDSYFDLSDPQVAATNKTKGSNAPCPNCGGASVQAIDYNSQGVPTSHTGFDQVTVTKTVDARGLTLTETVAPGSTLERTSTYTWEPDARLPATITEQIDVAGVPATRVTTFTYDGNQRLTQATIDPSSAGATRTWSWTHNAKGQVLTATSPGAGTRTFTYDGQGNLATSENSLLQTTTYGDYTPQGLARTITDPNGLQVKLTYDDRERVVEVKRGTAGTHWETMTIEYELYGQVKKVIQPDGTWVEYTYDDAHRLIEVKDQRGKMALTLSNSGDVIKQEIFAGASTLVLEEEYTYDNLRRLQKTIDSQNNETTRYYRGNDSVVQGITDPDGTDPWQWYQYFDDLGQPSILAYPNMAREVIHDRNGQLVGAHDGNYVYTYYTYNGFGEMVQTNSPDNGTSTLSYDAYGRPAVVTDARGVTSTTTYDVAGRPVQVVHDGSGATPVAANEIQTFIHDACSNGEGRLCEVSDHSGTTSFTYDLWGRVLTKTVTPAGGSSSFTLITIYAYNNAGQLVSTTYPSGKRVDLTYDRGLPATIEYDFQPILSDITYRPLSAGITGWDWDAFAGQIRFYYDLNGRLSSIEDADERDYVRNAKGWILGITDPLDTSADQVYTYNSTGNLTQADLAARPDPIDFSVDENDNTIRKTLGPLWTDEVFYDFYTNYSIDNRLPSVQVGANPATYLTHDASGNMLDDGAGLTMVYDAKGRPRSTSRLGTNATYAFNAMGQRVRKSGSHLSTGHRFYAYDEAGRTLGEYDGNGQAIEEYVYLDGFRPVALVRNIGLTLIADIYPILTDHLGTPRKVLDDTGAPQWTWDAKDPYGHQMPDQLVGGSTFVFNLRFPGQRYDSETGLYHNGFRDYNPATGRYVQADPIGLAGGWNPYAYVGANPLGASDPFGLKVDYTQLSTNDRNSMQNLIGQMRASSPSFDGTYQMISNSPYTYYVYVERAMETQQNPSKKPGNYYMNGRDGKRRNNAGALVFNPNYHVICDNSTLPFSAQVAHEFGHAYLDELVRRGEYSHGFDPFKTLQEGHATILEGVIGKELGIHSRGQSGNFWEAYRQYHWNSSYYYEGAK